MNYKIAEQINEQASIYFKYINGKGCAINSRVTDYSAPNNATTLLFYYDKKTYHAVYNSNKKCVSVKEVQHA